MAVRASQARPNTNLISFHAIWIVPTISCQTPETMSPSADHAADQSPFNTAEKKSKMPLMTVRAPWITF